MNQRLKKKQEQVQFHKTEGKEEIVTAKTNESKHTQNKERERKREREKEKEIIKGRVPES